MGVGFVAHREKPGVADHFPAAWRFPDEPHDFAASDRRCDAVRAHELWKGVVVAGVPALGGSIDADVQRANRLGVRGSRPTERIARMGDFRRPLIQDNEIKRWARLSPSDGCTLAEVRIDEGKVV